MKEIDKDFLAKEIDTLNEMAVEDVIYEESIDGPQEEPYLKEYRLDLKRWRQYHNSKKKHR